MEKQEKEIQSLILTDLRSMGKYCVCFKIMKSSDNGTPDLFFSTAITGSIFIETKKLKGVARKNQIKMVKKLNTCGTQAYFCYSWQEWVQLKRQIGLDTKNLPL